ncbi:hypothetical protein ACHAXS_011214 [Conticribra weissflogii]
MSSSEEYETDDYYPSHDSGIDTPTNINGDDDDTNNSGSRRSNAPLARAQPKTRRCAGTISPAGTKKNGGTRKRPRRRVVERRSSISSSSSEDDDSEDEEHSMKRTAGTNARKTKMNAEVQAETNDRDFGSGSDSDREYANPKDEKKKPISNTKKSNAANDNNDSSSEDDDDPFAHLSQFDSKRKNQIVLSSDSEDDSADSADSPNVRRRNVRSCRKNNARGKSGGKRSLCSSDSDDSLHSHKRGKENVGSSKSSYATTVKKKHNMLGDSDDSDDSFDMSSNLQHNNTRTGARAPKAKYLDDRSNSNQDKQNCRINGFSLESKI